MDDVIVNVGSCHRGSCPILSAIEVIEMKLSELAVQLTNIDAKLTEASAEIVAKIDALQLALADAEIPADATALIDEITLKATALADIVPD